MKYLRFILFFVTTFACAAGATEIGDKATTTISQLRVGMSEKQVLSILRPVSLAYGVVYFGGTGSRRFYFQLTASKQIWIEFEGHPRFTALLIGSVEPKRPWKRHTGDSITVE